MERDRLYILFRPLGLSGGGSAGNRCRGGGFGGRGGR